MSDDLLPHRLDQIRIVLHEPQNLVNIAGAIRAMKNMGLSRLSVVNPAEWDPWRITGIAHRSDDVVEATDHCDTLEEALRDCVMVVGTSARPRTAQRNYDYARPWAGRLVEAAERGPVALVFGREDRGLSNEALDRCDGVAIIPTDADYSSLNLAQACLLLSYEIFMAAEGNARPLPRGKRYTGLATRGELETMYAALEEGLAHIDFFSAREPEGVLRTIRTLLSRAEPDRQEAGIMRAMGFEMRNRVDWLLKNRDGAQTDEAGDTDRGDTNQADTNQQDSRRDLGPAGES